LYLDVALGVDVDVAPCYLYLDVALGVGGNIIMNITIVDMC
jgi:hypothetical protein